MPKWRKQVSVLGHPEILTPVGASGLTVCSVARAVHPTLILHWLKPETLANLAVFPREEFLGEAQVS